MPKVPMDDKPSTQFHSSIVKKFNLENNSVTLDLTEDNLISKAREETGLVRFGNERFLPAMRVLLDALENEAKLNPFGRYTARARTLRTLKNRLWANACFEAYPEIQQQKIKSPIIIIGPHRSGTTRLQRMMASDSQLQHLKAWEGINPAPRLNQPDSGLIARHAEAKQMLDTGQQINPEARIAHPMDADWPEEDSQLLNHSFCGMSTLGLYNVTDYYQRFIDMDKSSAYNDLADMMKLVSWSRGDPEDRRWIIKNPQHMLNLDVLIKTFPDAKLIFTHRDPIKTAGSLMSLMWHYAVQNTDIPCRAHIRDMWLNLSEEMSRRCIRIRESIPATQQLDIYYEDINHDWRKSMQHIYQFIDMPFTSKTESAMNAWLVNSERKGYHSGHRYNLEDFGTSNDEIDNRMKFYRDRYAIPYENR